MMTREIAAGKLSGFDWKVKADILSRSNVERGASNLEGNAYIAKRSKVLGWLGLNLWFNSC